MKILIATGNMGKLKEFKELFANSSLKNIELITLKDLKTVPEPDENGETFFANAYQKVMYYYNKFKLPTISEDSGLLVEALNNAPGVHTARYGSVNGEHTDSVFAYSRVLREMEGKINRKAKFVSAIYFYDGKTLISSIGEFKGEIANKPAGCGGFGYDPIFYLPEYKMTSAEINNNLKNKISHRGVSSNLLIEQLEKYYS